MINVNTAKTAYLNDSVQSRLDCIVRFGLTCKLCDNNDLHTLDFEHLDTKAVSLVNLYPCCHSHNGNKGTKEAANWFETKGLTNVLNDINETLTITVTQSQRDNAYVLYMHTVIDFLRNTIDTLPDGLIRLMSQEIPRNLLKNIDLANVRISRKQAIANRLDRYYNLDTAILED